MCPSAAKRPTVRVGVLLAAGDRLLLVQQARGAATYWLLPGGGLAMGETLADCACRELREELHLHIEPGRPLALVESISPDQTAYPKHVLHVILAATLSPDSVGPAVHRRCRHMIAPCCEPTSSHPPSCPLSTYARLSPSSSAPAWRSCRNRLTYLGRRW